MRQNKRRHVALLALLGALLFGAASATPALAAPPQALSPADAEHYAAAFDAVDRGDYIDAAMQAVDISDGAQVEL
jgi:hypothetical protein